MAIDENKRAQMRGVVDAAQISDAEVRQFFGPGSSAIAATRLAKESPSRYKMLRIIAQERGIL
jgi:hypothetical protein